MARKKKSPVIPSDPIGFASKRHYSLAWIENKTPCTLTCASVFDLFNTGDNAYEYCYAVQDNADAVLDLKVGERTLMNFNRDNPDSSGYIIRVK